MFSMGNFCSIASMIRVKRAWSSTVKRKNLFWVSVLMVNRIAAIFGECKKYFGLPVDNEYWRD